MVLAPLPLMIGFTVNLISMINHSCEISQYIKENYSVVPDYK